VAVKVDVITIFPRMIEAGLAEGVVGRACTAGLLDIVVHNLRDFTTDKHHVVDDVPFGGGPGMVMKPEPFFAALAAIRVQRGTPDAVVLLTPAGERFTQDGARRLAAINHVVLLCGRYEGIDERVREALATDEISIGDYVLSGGEVPALAVIDAVARLVPGVVGDDQSVEADCWTIRTTRDPRNSTDARCLTCCCRGTTEKFGNGGAKRRWRERWHDDRTCWPTRCSTPMNESG
jgi:tRNA (guanine37-N1)-methyltransferase